MAEAEKVLLARIDERLEAHCESQDKWQEGMDTRTKHIESCVAQDNVRIDRIEQREKGRARLLWITLTASVTAAVGFAGSWISTHWK